MSRFTRTLSTVAVAIGAAAVVSLSAAPAATAAPAAPVPVSAPVLAKTQGWLQIYSGQAPQGANAVSLRVFNDPTVGYRVTNANGRALYRFDKDTAQPSRSNCNGDCAVTWPPLLVNRGQALYVEGIDPALTGFIERADGSCQITVGGWPVYYFAKDKNPGELLGQGVGGVWFAVSPTGGKAK